MFTAILAIVVIGALGFVFRFAIKIFFDLLERYDERKRNNQ